MNPISRRRALQWGAAIAVAPALGLATMRGADALRARVRHPVVIIGSGATAITVATELLERGVPVLMLAVGAWNDGAPVAFDSSSLDRYDVPASAPFRWNRVFVVGGRLTRWSSHAVRFSPRDFREASALGADLAWPLTYDDLVPYYEKAERRLRITAGTASDPEGPAGIVTAPAPEGAFLAYVRAAAGRLGVTALSGRYAQFNVLEYLATLAKNPKFSLVPHAEVRRIELDPATNQPRAVTYLDQRRETEISVRVDRVVVAASNIASTQILLDSSCARYPDGLGNTSGALGRYVSDHLFVHGRARLRGVTVEDNPWQIYIPRANRAGLQSPSGVAGGYQYQMWASPQPNGDLDIGFVVFGEMTPDPNNRVSLAEGRTPTGGSRVRIDVRHRENDRRLLAAMLESPHALFPGAEIFATAEVPGGAVHDVGSCRMGADPRTSMVDSFCRLHEVPRVQVVDGGVFVTQAEKNPTLTMMAIAGRSGAQLARELTS